MKKKIAVLMGGNSLEKEISIKSGEPIYEALKKLNKYEVSKIVFTDPKELDSKITQDLDLVFIALHGKFGEDGQVQKYLDSRNIKYTGSGSESSRLSFNKELTKSIFRQNNILVPEGICVKKEDKKPSWKEVCELGGNNWIIKPTTEGSSFGVNFFETEEELSVLLDQTFEICEELLIEKVIKGRELAVPVVNEKALSPIEIIPKLNTWFDFESKYSEGGAEEVDAKLPAGLDAKIRKISEAAYKILDNEVYSRVDFILDENNNCYLLEVNNLPGMTAASIMPKSAAILGMSYEDLVEEIVEKSFQKYL